MTFTLRHPSASAPHVYAVYGYDPKVRGYWAEVHRERHVIISYAAIIHGYVDFDVAGGVLDRYNALNPSYDTVRPVVGLLRFLGEKGFFDLVDVEEAIGIIETKGLEGLPTRLTRIASVLRNLDGGVA